MDKNYDVIIIGAGSIGLPAAYHCAYNKLKVLAIDSEQSPGQQNNKKAIGGVRATHSDYGKIHTCLRSIEILSHFTELYGYDIGWMSNGYSFPAYEEQDEIKLKELMVLQQQFGLNIQWVNADDYQKLVPGITKEGLRGATYSPDDGSCSPLLVASAYYFMSNELGVRFRWNEKVTSFRRNNQVITGVITDKGEYNSALVVNCAGNNAREIGSLLGLDLPVYPDNHEAGITEPVKRFFEPMVVDMRKRPGSENFYFYQNIEGQVVFCITPDPPLPGIDNRSTSEFLPLCSQRMLEIYPRLRYLKVRRTWRGQYPMTPDGFPIVGRTGEYQNFVNAIGMCGQGFMLGPGIGEIIARICIGELSDHDRKILRSYGLYRSFTGVEAFK